MFFIAHCITLIPGSVIMERYIIKMYCVELLSPWEKPCDVSAIPFLFYLFGD